MSVEEFANYNFRPFNQTDYYNTKTAFENMVELKIITPDEMTAKLKILKEATHE